MNNNDTIIVFITNIKRTSSLLIDIPKGLLSSAILDPAVPLNEPATVIPFWSQVALVNESISTENTNMYYTSNCLMC
ncbi:hypothetical protein I4U23_020128 [Adineta vaga]|nr:hypothetical protein I4U23_020128 [Adineta vaga]